MIEVDFTKYASLHGARPGFDLGGFPAGASPAA